MITDDKHAAAQNSRSQERRISLARQMRSEQGQILQGSQFRNSPTLGRLLIWLIDETLAGRGDNIKSYTIAVEGLGRPEEFDSQTDSYPRVQIGRLRKALETHYSQQGSSREQCLYLQHGSYRVRLGDLDQAYPELYRPIFQEPAPTPFMAKNQYDQPALPGPARTSGRQVQSMLLPGFWAAIALVGLILVTVLSGSVGLSDPERIYVAKRSRSPIVILEPVKVGGAAQKTGTADEAYAIIADGLSRSWVAQLRLGSGGANPSEGRAAASYQLDTQISEVTDGRSILFARLIDVSSSTVVSSTTHPIDNSKSPDENIGPLIAQLTGPFGAIARYETKQLNDNYQPGYPCLLHYLSFSKSRDPVMGVKVSRCLQKQSPEAHLEPVRLAFMAFHSIDNARSTKDRPSAITKALGYAWQAVDANPQEAYAQFALSRTYFVINDCDAGRRYARLAIAANPYDQILFAILGNFNSVCGFSEGAEMLEKANDLRVVGESYARLSLVLAAVRSGNLSRLASLKDGVASRDGGLLNHYLCETLIAAALGDTITAKLEWEKFTAASQQRNAPPDDLLRDVILADVVREKVITFLKIKGVIIFDESRPRK